MMKGHFDTEYDTTKLKKLVKTKKRNAHRLFSLKKEKAALTSGHLNRRALLQSKLKHKSGIHVQFAPFQKFPKSVPSLSPQFSSVQQTLTTHQQSLPQFYNAPVSLSQSILDISNTDKSPSPVHSFIQLSNPPI